MNRTFVVSSSQRDQESHCGSSRIGENAKVAISQSESPLDSQDSFSQSLGKDEYADAGFSDAVSQSQDLGESHCASSQSGLPTMIDEIGNDASSQSQECKGSSSSQSQEKPQWSSEKDPSRVVVQTQTNSSYFKVPFADESCLGGQSLNGHLLSLESCSHIGRFMVYAWMEVSGPLPCPEPQPRPDHRSKGQFLSVSKSFPISNQHPLRSNHPTPTKKKLSVRMRSKRKPKQRLTEGSSSSQDNHLSAVQRGIKHYFQRLDGPMGDRLPEDFVL